MSDTTSMHAVTAADGTEIGYEYQGGGDPIILVHGSMATRHTWDRLRPRLGEDRSIVVPDRRGRGASGDADAHSLATEVADLTAIIDAVEGDPAVFGHSFGGLCALEAARQRSVDRLILYDPTVLTDEFRVEADLADRMAALVEDGEREAAVKEFLGTLDSATNVEEWPIWPECTRLAETIVRENWAIESYELDDAIEVSAPTLLLRGGESPRHLREGAAALADALVGHTCVELDGIGHNGLSRAPEQVADEVRRFLDDD
ncbi:alpha/beta fold hydrolase [Halomicrobium sp. IBSBa]|uniref:alpha/beta fold hydrolase n=1 Tax=Halomicrobium sp. IBSBa TaxID=2778916 RepID=UPI001ABFD908|nr:alpha/beta hydrolase [Halomicrobium sp. IBSBa]